MTRKKLGDGVFLNVNGVRTSVSVSDGISSSVVYSSKSATTDKLIEPPNVIVKPTHKNNSIAVGKIEDYTQTKTVAIENPGGQSFGPGQSLDVEEDVSNVRPAERVYSQVNTGAHLRGGWTGNNNQSWAWFWRRRGLTRREIRFVLEKNGLRFGVDSIDDINRALEDYLATKEFLGPEQYAEEWRRERGRPKQPLTPEREQEIKELRKARNKRYYEKHKADRRAENEASKVLMKIGENIQEEQRKERVKQEQQEQRDILQMITGYRTQGSLKRAMMKDALNDLQNNDVPKITAFVEKKNRRVEDTVWGDVADDAYYRYLRAKTAREKKGALYSQRYRRMKKDDVIWDAYFRLNEFNQALAEMEEEDEFFEELQETDEEVQE